MKYLTNNIILEELAKRLIKTKIGKLVSKNRLLFKKN